MNTAAFYYQEAVGIRNQHGYAAALQYLFSLLLQSTIDQATYTWCAEALREAS